MSRSSRLSTVALSASTRFQKHRSKESCTHVTKVLDQLRIRENAKVTLQFVVTRGNVQVMLSAAVEDDEPRKLIGMERECVKWMQTLLEDP